jgi:hypothetical protein
MYGQTRTTKLSGVVVVPVLTIALALGTGVSQAKEKKWTVKLQPVYLNAHGHDQHVLNVTETVLGPPQSFDRTPVNLDTDSGYAYRGEVQYAWGEWTLGLDFFWFVNSQSANRLTAEADGPAGPVNAIVFEIADQSYSSVIPGEVLYYRVLGDTDLAVWTADFYATRTLAGNSKGGLHMQLGLRFGDFDNDYRAVVGIEDTVGTRVDASSNYDRMMGPLVGFSGDVNFGKNRIEGYIGQSLLLGTAKLTNLSQDFTGPFSEDPAVSLSELFSESKDVAIPVTELRFEWTYRINSRVALGLGTDVSAWWDVPVPPGIIPDFRGNRLFHENTIVYFGMRGIVELKF